MKPCRAFPFYVDNDSCGIRHGSCGKQFLCEEFDIIMARMILRDRIVKENRGGVPWHQPHGADVV